MSWKYEVASDNSTMDVYDHQGNIVKTISNDGQGFTIPDDIKAVMEEKIKNEFVNNNLNLNEYTLEAMLTLANEKIAKKK